jgi:hypothetical protein
VVVWEYASDASVVNEKFSSVGQVHLVAVQHLARPCVTWAILRHFPAFLVEEQGKVEWMPTTMMELMGKMRIRVAIKPRDDLEDRYDGSWVAFYVAGGIRSVENCLSLLDSFWLFRCAHPEPGEEFPSLPTVTIHKHCTLALDTTRLELQTTTEVVEGGAPVGAVFYKMPPCTSGSHVNVTVDCDGSVVKLIFAGPLYLLRAHFTQAGVPGGYVESVEEAGQPSSTKGKPYYRIYTVDADVKSEVTAALAFVKDGLGGILIEVRLRKVAPAESSSSPFVEGLSALPNVEVS